MERDLQILFKEFISECQYSKRLRTETLRGFEAAFKLFNKIMPEVNNTEHLTVSMLNEFFKRIQKRHRMVGQGIIKVGLKDSTLNTYRNKLNSFIVWLIQRKRMLNNPFDNIKIRNPEYTDQRALETDDIHRLYAAIALHSKTSLALKRDTAMVSVLFFCGLRRGEFISLRVVDIDLFKDTLTVRSETSKSKRSRVIPLHPTVSFHLREYLKDRNIAHYTTEYLFVSNTEDRALSKHGLKHWVKRLSNLSGVKFHLHRFRHSFACNLAKLNVNLVKIQTLMGHSDIKMTTSYLRSLTFEDSRGDIGRLSI